MDEIITVRISEEVAARIDELINNPVNEERWSSKAHFIRSAISFFLREEEKKLMINNGGVNNAGCSD